MSTKIITKEEALSNEKWLIESIKNGLIFIYPTDTIYGLGCNATNNISVKKIREIKLRYEKPFSVLIPHTNWIDRHCLIDEDQRKLIHSKLPGPYTFFVNIKNTECVSESVNPEQKNQTLGIRIPANWFSKIVQKSDVPFITTSVNTSGKPFMKSVDDLDIAIKEKVDIIIYDGPINGKESQKIDLRKTK